jgi:hypothetical protein
MSQAAAAAGGSAGHPASAPGRGTTSAGTIPAGQTDRDKIAGTNQSS